MFLSPSVSQSMRDRSELLFGVLILYHVPLAYFVETAGCFDNINFIRGNNLISCTNGQSTFNLAMFNITYKSLIVIFFGKSNVLISTFVVLCSVKALHVVFL